MARAEGDGFTHAPFALFPRKFPKGAFEAAVRLAEPYNKLVDAVARHPTYLADALSGVLDGDAFTARLFDIYQNMRGADPNFAKRVHLGIHRSDYMLDEPSGKLMQIELNTIASSFGALSSRVTELHTFLRARNERPADGELPPNRAIQTIAKAMQVASSVWQGQHARRQEVRHAVVFVVHERERKFFDQRMLEFELPKPRRDSAEANARRNWRPVKACGCSCGQPGCASQYYHGRIRNICLLFSSWVHAR